MARNVVLGMLNIHNKLGPMAARREEVLRLIDEAGRMGCQLVMTPECADHHRTFEAVEAHSKGKKAVRETLGLRLDSPWTKEVIGLARKHRMVVIPNIVHLDEDKAYDASIAFGPDGSILGRYCKSHLAGGEELVFDEGDALEPIDTPFGRLGIIICWDIHFPEIMRCYELQDADILLWTTMRQGPLEEDMYRILLPSKCLTHGLPLAVSTYSIDDQVKNRHSMSSIIYDAYGKVVSGGMMGGSCVVRGTVDLDLRPEMTYVWDNPKLYNVSQLLRRQRRTDLYKCMNGPRGSMKDFQ